MANPAADYPMFDFSGGVNTAKPQALLAPSELVSGKNVYLTPGGGFEKRPGYRRVSAADPNHDTATQPIKGLHLYRTPAGTRYIVRVRNGDIESYAGGAWTDITSTLTVSTTVRTKMDVFRGEIVGTDTANAIWSWTGTGNASAITNTIAGGADTIDKAATLVIHRERLVLGDVTATESAVQTRYESVIWPSDAGTLDTFDDTPTGKIHIGQGDGDSITCMLSLLGYLIVFKQNSMWRISDYGVADTQVALRVGNVGTASRFGACVVDSLVYFFDDEFRLWSYDPRQGDSPDALQEHTTRTASLVDRSTLSEDSDDRGIIYWPDMRVVLTFCGDDDFSSPSATNCAWVYHIDQGHARTKWNWDRNWITYAQGISVDYTQHPALYLGSTNGYVARVLGNRVDDATGAITGTNTAIDMDAYLAPITCNDFRNWKKWCWAYVYTNSRQTLHHTADGPTADTITLGLIPTLPENTASGNPQSFTVTMPDQGDRYDSVAEQILSGMGKWIQFRIRQNTSRHIRVAGIVLSYETLGPRLHSIA